jgi:thiamine biosynthesis lipoprotein
MRTFFLLALVSLLGACGTSPKPSLPLTEIKGKTMGSTFAISYLDSLDRDFSPQFDSLLKEFNAELSTYDSTARISLLNRQGAVFIGKQEPQHLVRNLDLALAIHRQSEGWFNPAIYPLVAYWGFGKNRKAVEQVDTAVVDSLRQLLRPEDFLLETTDTGVWIRKKDPRLQLDLNALAPGDAADLIAQFLQSRGIRHFLVDIGGEMRALGHVSQGFCWRVGITRPDEKAQQTDVQAVIKLCDRALATSGNYRNFHVVAGRRYAHTISPFTGFPSQSRLLSVSILAPTAAQADAYATACMAMGEEKAWLWVQQLPQVDAFFILAKEQGEGYVFRTTAGMDKILQQR